MSAAGSESAFGIAEETTWGVPVAPTNWRELISESMGLSQEFSESSAMRPGVTGGRSMKLLSRRQQTRRSVSGDLTTEVTTQGFGLLLKHILGSVAGTASLTVAQQAATAAYLQTFKPGPIKGKGLSLQKLIRGEAQENIAVHTYTGCKVTSAEFSLNNEILQAVIAFDGQNEVLTFPAGTPSYGSARNFTFQQGAIKFNNAVLANVMDPTLRIENPMVTDDFFLGNNGLKDEQKQNGALAVTGGFTARVIDQATLYDKWVNNVPISYEFSFVGAQIATGYFETIKFIVPQIVLQGETPKIGGPEALSVSPTWMAYQDDAGSVPITIQYTTKDVTVN